MASSQTQNFQLNQWAETDRVLRTEFNADNAKIDAALETLTGQVCALPRLATGSYTGTGTNQMTLTVGFRPKAAMIRPNSTHDESLALAGGSAVFISSETAGIKMASGSSYYTLEESDSGFTLTCTGGAYDHQFPISACNRENEEYIWWALG